MYRGQTVLVIIPARGGSKRVPHKNKRLLGGKPLVAYAIGAARQSNHVDRVMVSTDDTGIAKIAKRYGAEIPFMRPKSLASDTAPVSKTILHALAHLKKTEKWNPDIVVLVQPTSPLVRSKDIDQAIQTLVESAAHSCVTVTPTTEHPEWMFTFSGKKLRQKFPSKISKRSQEMSPLYRLNGAVYASQTTIVLKKRRVFDPANLVGVVMPKDRSIDIDEPEDWKKAAALI